MLVRLVAPPEEGQPCGPSQRCHGQHLYGQQDGDEGAHAGLPYPLVDEREREVAVERGHPGNGGNPNHESGGQNRLPSGQPAHLRQPLDAHGVYHGTRTEEEERLEQGVVRQMVGGAGQADPVGGAEGHRQNPHLGDRVEGEKTLEVVLEEGHDRPPDP